MSKNTNEMIVLAKQEKLFYENYLKADIASIFREYLISLFDRINYNKQDFKVNFSNKKIENIKESLQKELKNLIERRNKSKQDYEDCHARLDELIKLGAEKIDYPEEIMKLSEEQYKLQEIARNKKETFERKQLLCEEFENFIKIYTDKRLKSKDEQYQMILDIALKELKISKQQEQKKLKDFKNEYEKSQEVADKKTKESIYEIEYFLRKLKNN